MSNSASSGSAAAVRDDRFAALADDRRRTVLRLVSERSPDGIGKDDLADEFAAVTEDKPRGAVSADEHRRALVELHHKLLPRLTDAGLLEEADDVVRVPDERPLDDAAVAGALSESNGDVEAAELDVLFEALADERRRRALAVLDDRNRPLTTATLARAVAAAEADAAEREVSRDRVDEVRAALVHAHLPLLHEATLIGYDEETGRVSYEGHPRVRAERVRSADGAPAIETTDTDAAADARRSPFPL